MKTALFLLFVMLRGSAMGQELFEFAGRPIKPGETASVKISVQTISGDSTFVPVTIIHGKEKGPVLGLIAGIHGYEYPPIMALQKLQSNKNAADLHGTIILVQIANVKAFFGRSVFYSPVDGKNLNRSFPGSKSGTLTEALAYTISTVI